jgi:hypothetical protein
MDRPRPRTTGFPVQVLLTLECSDREINLEKKIQLPFAAFPGLTICANEEAETYATIETVFYFEDHKSFQVICRKLTRKTCSSAVTEKIARREGWSVQ